MIPSSTIALITAGCILASTTAGLLIRNRLPDHHLRDESKDVLKTASGLIATLVALVLGLLVSSSKSAFDSTNTGLTQAGASLGALHGMLVRYGPETVPIRTALRTNLERVIAHLWPTTGQGDLEAVTPGERAETVVEMIRDLKPQTEAQQYWRQRALQQAEELQKSRWLMVVQAHTAPPTAFLVVLIFWLSVLFLSFGLLAPHNPTAVTALLVAALSIAGAVMLILELSAPFHGLIRASPVPLQVAADLMRR